MLNWKEFCDELDIGSLVPDDLTAYRAAVVDGVAFFLEHLSADRLAGILTEQAALPDDADAGERLIALARHCPALHKLGQILARDRRLPSHFRAQLQRLESMAPSGDTAWVDEELKRQCDGDVLRRISIDERPLAEASVALIVPFKWRNSGRGTERSNDIDGVFKLLKPGIERKLEEDLELLQHIGVFLDERCRHYHLPEIHYADTFAQVRDLLAREVRLDGEQRHMRAARAAFAKDSSVVVPEIFAFSSPRMTAMTRVFGRPVTDVAHLSSAQKRTRSEKIVDALLSRPIWSTTEPTMFHADPHAGNLLSTDDGKLAILDWSLVGHLGKRDQLSLTQILLGAMTSDTQRIVQAIDDLAVVRGDERSLCQTVDASLSQLKHGFWPSLKWLTGLMDAATTTSRIRFRRDLIMFRKVLHTTQGVVADISEDCRFNWVLASSFLAGLAKETGHRLIASPFSHHFSTHFSNAELMHLMCSAPLIGWVQVLDLQRRMLDHALPKTT